MDYFLINWFYVNCGVILNDFNHDFIINYLLFQIEDLFLENERKIFLENM